MKQNLEKIIGYTLTATDEQIGKVDEVYFEDNTWMIRYLIIETAGLFSGRKVLISPEAVLNVDNYKEALIVSLSSEQIINSPEIDTQKPVYRQQEIALSKHYGWPNYWAGGLWGAGIGTSGMIVGNRLPLTEAIECEKYLESGHEERNLHLRSSKKIKGYKIKAVDGTIGELEDFVVDVIGWKIDFLVIDRGKWLPGNKALMPATRVTGINWESSAISVDVDVSCIKNSPEYRNERIPEAYAAALHQYYEKTV